MSNMHTEAVRRADKKQTNKTKNRRLTPPLAVAAMILPTLKGVEQPATACGYQSCTPVGTTGRKSLDFRV